jgi:GT2 family glycosyltransferase
MNPTPQPPPGELAHGAPHRERPDVSSPEPPLLSVVIVNWNTRALLHACLQSVRRAPAGREAEIIVVDNASSDGSLDMVRSEFPAVRVIANAENLGFARANNLAIPTCRGRYVMLLNSDTVVPDGALHGLLEFMERHPRAAAAGPRLTDERGVPQVMAAGYLPTLATAFSYFFFLSRVLPDVFRGLSLTPGRPGSGPRRVEWLTGACLLVRRNVFQRLGGLPEDYFMYVEDIDFCQRMVKAGYELYTVPSVDVVHIGGASGRDVSLEASTRWVTNLHRFFARDHSRASTVVFDLIHGVGLGVRAALYFLRSLAPGGAVYRGKARVVGASSRKAFELAGSTLAGSRISNGDA